MKSNKCCVRLPKQSEKYLSFKNYRYQERVPFAIYADLECILEKCNDANSNLHTKSKSYQKHIPFKNEKHAEILLWIQKNISKGTHNPDAVLGWTSGPDSAKWPSTNLEDYKETLSYLMLITH
ncbi:hypothetical protein RN001_008355 [Aquatica leii]|uniref:Uncharacterized protein n=1 Tax=Aquatica leii TaxID=1421715 RepID=A0AAN7PA83_9COLE|nr:hypothetical protein RN001_008355 [Aquatica leii]